MNICCCFLSFFKSGFWYVDYLKVIFWLWFEALHFIKMKWYWVNVQVKQGKRVVSAIESRIQIFNCKVFSNVVFRINSIVCTPAPLLPFCWGGGGGKGWLFSGGSCSFYTKNKLKFEIFNNKKSLSMKMFFSIITKDLNWEILN